MNPVNETDEPYVFTSVRYDPILTRSAPNTAASCNNPCPVYLLQQQWTRMSVAKWTIFQGDNKDSKAGAALSSPSNLLRGILSAVRAWSESHPQETPESLRIRIRLYAFGRVTTEMWPIPPVSLAQLFPSSFDLPENAAAIAPMVVVLDLEPTEPAEATMFKTSDRSSYGRARAGANIYSLKALKEVLLYNTNDDILDGSQATPYFYRQGRWITPTAAAGGQQGTTRKWALQVGLAVEADVSKDSLTDGEVIWLSNAVQGFRMAVFQHRTGEIQQPEAADCDLISKQLR